MLTPLVLVLSLAAAPSTDSIESVPFEVVPAHRPDGHPLRGVWASRGYGLLANVGPEKVEAWDHSPAGTVRQAYDPTAYFVGASYRVLGDVMQMTAVPGSSTLYTWDRLAELPAACATSPAADPVAVFDYFWRVVEHHYAYFELRGVDWDARREALAPRVDLDTTDEELWAILCESLAGLRDDHVFLTAEIDGIEREWSDGFCRELDPALQAAFEAQDALKDFATFRSSWFETYRMAIGDGLLGGNVGVAANSGVVWGRIGPIGYINVVSMGGFARSEDVAEEAKAVHELMDRVLTELADTDGLILDITINTGGYEEVQMALSSHFVDEPRPAFRKQALDLPNAAVQEFSVFPASGARYLKPVSLVTSDFTVSAGEDFTLAMRELPHVTHRGTRTRGAFSDILEKRLPNGWLVGLSNEAYYDLEGRNYEAVGVAPEIEIPIFVAGELDVSHSRAIYRIVDAMIAGE